MSLTTIEYKNISTVSALSSLVSGEAAIYQQEVSDRIELFKDETIPDKTVKDYTVKPFLLYYVDVEYNPEWF